MGRLLAARRVEVDAVRRVEQSAFGLVGWDAELGRGSDSVGVEGDPDPLGAHGCVAEVNDVRVRGCECGLDLAHKHPAYGSPAAGCQQARHELAPRADRLEEVHPAQDVLRALGDVGRKSIGHCLPLLVEPG